MRVFGLQRGFYHIARHKPTELTAQAEARLRWLSCFEALRKRGLSGQEACLELNMPRSTLYRWQQRFKEQGPVGLQDRSRRPHHRRPAHLES